MQLKILKDGNRTTYILTRDGESIPLVSVEKDIKVEKTRIESEEIAYALIAALRHVVKRSYGHSSASYGPMGCPIERFYWEFVRAYEALRAQHPSSA